MVDYTYNELVNGDEWPQALDVREGLLKTHKIDLFKQLPGFGWVVPADEPMSLKGAIRLTYAGICLARNEDAKRDASKLVRLLNGVGYLARGRRGDVLVDELGKEIGDEPSRRVLLLLDDVVRSVGSKLIREPGTLGKVHWSPQLQSLGLDDTPDALLERLLGIGVAAYQSRHFWETVEAVEVPSQADAGLAAELRSALPYKGLIDRLKSLNFAGFSFDYEALSKIVSFVDDWDDVFHRFRHPLLERGRLALYVSARELVVAIGVWTFPTAKGRQVVPPEWEQEQPQRFRWVVRELGRMASEVVHWHQKLMELISAIVVP